MRFGLTMLAVLAGCLALAPAARAQQPLAAHDYVLFFRADAAELLPQAEVIAAKAARATKDEQAAGRLGHVKVIGYSDATSAPDAARKLSLARAEAVKRTLVAHGIAEALIRVEGRGKPRSKAAKSDAVKELVNRRARIVLYGK